MTRSPFTKEFSKLVNLDIFHNAKGHVLEYVLLLPMPVQGS